MSLANKITLGRLFLTLVLFVLLALLDETDPSLGAVVAGFFLFIAVTATDALDGYYARKRGEVSDFGRIADPAVDKITVAGTLVFLCAAPWAQDVLPPWIVVLIVAREFLVTSIRSYLEAKGVAFGAESLGKLKMIVQCVAIPGVFFHEIVADLFPETRWAVTGAWWLACVLVWCALVLTVVSGVSYVRRTAALLRGPSAL